MALAAEPVARLAPGVRTTLAPRKRISLRRSIGEGLRHDEDERVALLRADHGEADAGVAAGELDDGLAGLEFSGPLGVFDHAEGEAVFDGAEGIEGLDLDEEVDVRRGQPVDLHDGCIADGFKDVGVVVFPRCSPRPR